MARNREKKHQSLVHQVEMKLKSKLETKKQESLILLAFLPFSIKHETGFEPVTARTNTDK